MIKLNNLIELFLGCGLIFFQISPSLSQSDGRIVGGKKTTIDNAPYLVQLRSNDFIFCSGTLVSEKYVISAAHCFDEEPTNFSVVGGATNSYNDPGSARSYVTAYAIPTNFNNITYDKDIAVIKLEKPLTGKFIKPISMKCDKWKDGAAVKIFGWGKQAENDKVIPIQLQTVQIKTIEHKWCKWLYLTKRKITDLMFCAAAKGKDSCSGDSGGPAIVNKQFCGVVSWGRGCGRTDAPGVYTNLIPLSSFVQRAMKLLEKY